jgi:ferredoxin
MRVRVDEAICQGHTLCAMAAPEIFHLRDEDGHAFVVVSELTGEQEVLARKAAAGCPEQAIIIEE